ncbi:MULTISPECIES: amidase [Micromonospora]|nr:MULTISPECIES: amidase [Micromonospora]NES13803.1 indole acetimide hydrolase [Micromonospora sp. PPF5-17B]NES37105.1 indole acetimide hydrolase [Micromonospora solifontis]NES55920.1 indole acetimide hydrolase [Micromonospora sp. PPF5-6]
MTELWRMGALEIAAAIRAGETTSRAVLDALRARIEEVNGHLNAVVGLDENATAAADAADRAVAAGEPVGPLHGVPVTIKECIDVAGCATTHGAAALSQALAPRDAPLVERLRAAGAIPFARTNMPDFGARGHTDSSLHGRTHNPWDPAVTAGGSSGGEASAIASGMSPLGVGNDVGGSVRDPANRCGIAAIKASTGVVPHASSVPPEEALITYQLMLGQGVLARRVADVRAALLAVAGPHPRDPLALPVTLTAPDPDARLRVAVAAEPAGCDVDPAIAAAVRAAADRLAAAGHIVEEAAPTGYERILDIWSALVMNDFRVLLPALEGVLAGGSKAYLTYAQELVPPLNSATVTALYLERHATELRWHRFLSDWDVLLTPTGATPPPDHDADIASLDGLRGALDLLRPMLPANLMGLPAAVVPCGMAYGLPVGAQFTARRFGDLTALAAAQAVEDACGVLTPIDPVVPPAGDGPAGAPLSAAG